MNRIRGGAALALGVALLLAAGGVARAQETTGRVTGRVTDKDTSMPLGGVTVVLQGPQGEDATLTDDKGEYHFTSLPVGTYVIRFYVAQRLDPGRAARRDRLGRQDGARERQDRRRRPGAPQENYVITGKPPAVDIGSARVGAEFDQEFMHNVPLDRTYGDVIETRPGRLRRSAAATSRSAARPASRTSTSSTASTSPASSTATSRRRTPRLGGGTNLPLEFLQQVDVNSGGYQAEWAARMGGVINSVLKSGSNEFHGSAFSYWSPYWLSAEPDADHHRRRVARLRAQARLRHQHRRRGRRPDHQGQAVLLGRLRAALPEHPRLPPDVPAARRADDDGRRRWTRPAIRSRSRTRTGARASPSRARPTTTPRRSTSSPVPSTT